MELDAELMFECLIYLNLYYYPVFATWETIMTAAKYRSLNVATPHIEQDAGVVATMLIAEISKILLYRKYKDIRRVDLITAVAVLLTLVTLTGVFYILFYQTSSTKLENILCSLMIMLAATEVIFGVLQILPCCKKVQYY